MKGFLRLAIILSVLFSLAPLKAQAEPYVPEKIRKKWGLPDCRSTEQILVFTSDELMTFRDGSLTRTPIEKVRTIDDYWVVETRRHTYAVAISADGVLTMAPVDSRQFNNARPAWDDLPMDLREEYMHCAVLPNNRTGMLFQQSLKKMADFSLPPGEDGR